MEPDRSLGHGFSTLLNRALQETVHHLLDAAPHADFFRNAVSCVVVADYRDFVPESKEMSLGKMLERSAAGQYTSVSAFRADLQLIYENAAAYNGRQGGRHAYEPVIHWAGDLLAAAEEQLKIRIPSALSAAAELREEPQQAGGHPLLLLPASQSDVAIAEADDTAATVPPCPRPATTEAPTLPTQLEPSEGPQGEGMHSQRPSGGGSASPRVGGEHGNGSAGQQSSSPSSGSGGEGSHSGLEALLAAVELAAEQDSAVAAAPRGSTQDGVATSKRDGDAPAPLALPMVGAPPVAAAAEAGPDSTPPARLSYPGCASPSSSKLPPCMAIATLSDGQEGVIAHQQQHSQRQQLVILQPATAPGEEPVGSSEDGGMTCARSGGAGAGVATGNGGTAACSSYLTSNAFKNRRHKSKVYIKPNKVVYLPTTFVEEEFDVTALPMDCELRVEADGVMTDETFRVTIKAVPRQGLSTMYCMTNVMRFQQQYLNWQIYNWTRIDNNHIKIHLQSPSPSQSHLQRPDMDRAASLAETNRGANGRISDDGGGTVTQRPAGHGSLKRKSDTGRYNVSKMERRMVAEPGRDWAVDLRLSSNGYAHRPSPIPESPPASPQRRVSAGLSSQLPPRAPTAPGLLQSAPRVQLHHMGQAPHLQPLHLLPPQQASHAANQLGPVAHRGGSGHAGLFIKQEVHQDLPHDLAHLDTLAALQLQLSQAPGHMGVAGSLITGHLSAQQQHQQQQYGGMRGSVNGGNLGLGGPAPAGAPWSHRGGPAGAGAASTLSQAALLEQHLQDLAAQGDLPPMTALQLAIATALQQQQQQQHKQQQHKQQAYDLEAFDAPVSAFALNLAVPDGTGDVDQRPEHQPLQSQFLSRSTQQQQQHQPHMQLIQQRAIRTLGVGSSSDHSCSVGLEGAGNGTQRRESHGGSAFERGQNGPCATSPEALALVGPLRASHQVHAQLGRRLTQDGRTGALSGGSAGGRGGEEEGRSTGAVGLDGLAVGDDGLGAEDKGIHRFNGSSGHSVSAGCGGILGGLAASDLGLGRLACDVGFSGNGGAGGAGRRAGGCVAVGSGNGPARQAGPNAELQGGSYTAAGLDLSLPLAGGGSGVSMSAGGAGNHVTAELMALLSPNKRLKLAVGGGGGGTAQVQAAAVDVDSLGSMEVHGLLEVAMGLRAGQLTGASTEAAVALAGLRPGAFGLGGGRSVVQISPELLGQLM